MTKGVEERVEALVASDNIDEPVDGEMRFEWASGIPITDIHVDEGNEEWGPNIIDDEYNVIGNTGQDILMFDSKADATKVEDVAKTEDEYNEDPKDKDQDDTTNRNNDNREDIQMDIVDEQQEQDSDNHNIDVCDNTKDEHDNKIHDKDNIYDTHDNEHPMIDNDSHNTD